MQKISLLLKLKRLSYGMPDLKLFYNFLVISYFVWVRGLGGFYSGLLNRIDAVQQKAFRMGIQESYQPIREIVHRADRKILENFEDTNHILHHFLPKRTASVSEKLRKRPIQSSIINRKFSFLSSQTTLRQYNL